jgi:hypothetical protein
MAQGTEHHEKMPTRAAAAAAAGVSKYRFIPELHSDVRILWKGRVIWFCENTGKGSQGFGEMCVAMCLCAIYIYVYVCMYVYIYIYVCIDRERVCMYVYVCVCDVRILWKGRTIWFCENVGKGSRGFGEMCWVCM